MMGEMKGRFNRTSTIESLLTKPKFNEWRDCSRHIISTNIKLKLVYCRVQEMGEEW